VVGGEFCGARRENTWLLEAALSNTWGGLWQHIHVTGHISGFYEDLGLIQDHHISDFC
jgi:hypothetical protein